MRPRVLVFNHSPNLLTLYRYVLSQYGFDPFVYQQEMTSLGEVESMSPDVIILGNVRGYNDVELAMLRELKDHVRLSRIPVIVCSTFGEKLLADDHIAAMSRVFLIAKPFDIKSLIACVQQALDSARTS